MPDPKQCSSCQSFEPLLAVFCSQCRMRIGLPDLSYKMLDDDNRKSVRDFLRLVLLSLPIVAIITVISLFFTGCGNPAPPKASLATASAEPKT